ncbi:unnamed protein product, partial [marine sediment metagenome]
MQKKTPREAHPAALRADVKGALRSARRGLASSRRRRHVAQGLEPEAALTDEPA